MVAAAVGMAVAVIRRVAAAMPRAVKPRLAAMRRRLKDRPHIRLKLLLRTRLHRARGFGVGFGVTRPRPRPATTSNRIAKNDLRQR